MYLFSRLGDKRFSSNESLEAISWGAVSEKDKRSSGISEYIENFLYFQGIPYMNLVLKEAFIFHKPTITWVKVFRIIPEFRILRLTFHRKSASKC